MADLPFVLVRRGMTMQEFPQEFGCKSVHFVGPHVLLSTSQARNPGQNLSLINPLTGRAVHREFFQALHSFRRVLPNSYIQMANALVNFKGSSVQKLADSTHLELFPFSEGELIGFNPTSFVSFFTVRRGTLEQKWRWRANTGQTSFCLVSSAPRPYFVIGTRDLNKGMGVSLEFFDKQGHQASIQVLEKYQANSLTWHVSDGGLFVVVLHNCKKIMVYDGKQLFLNRVLQKVGSSWTPFDTPTRRVCVASRVIACYSQLQQCAKIFSIHGVLLQTIDLVTDIAISDDLTMLGVLHCSRANAASHLQILWALECYRRPKLQLLLCARNFSPACPFHKSVFPLDLFKLLCYSTYLVIPPSSDFKPLW